MSIASQRLLFASCIQVAASASRQHVYHSVSRLRPAASIDSVCRHHRQFATSIRRLQDDDKKAPATNDETDVGGKLSEDALAEARAADEPLKPSDEAVSIEDKGTSSTSEAVDDAGGKPSEDTLAEARAADEPLKPSDEAVPDESEATSSVSEIVDDAGEKPSEDALAEARAADEPLKPSDEVVSSETEPASSTSAAVTDTGVDQPADVPTETQAAGEVAQSTDVAASSEGESAENLQLNAQEAAADESISATSDAASAISGEAMETPSLEQDGEIEDFEFPADAEEHADTYSSAEESGAAKNEAELAQTDGASGLQKSPISHGGVASTIMAYGESEAHQDLREYAHLAAWELPLLHKLRKPFVPPTAEQPLRFRYTSYLGDTHPASRKVVVEFQPSALPDLTTAQQIKLIKLVGPRYNPSKQLIKMSCESFETPAQNKRHLGELIRDLIKEAKDPKDMFEDVPIDLRHHKQKPVYKFPEEWKVKPSERQLAGVGGRGQGKDKIRAIQELQRRGELVHGESIIKEALRQKALAQPRTPARTGPVVLGSRNKSRPSRF